MTKAAAAKVLKSWKNEATEVVLRKYGTPARDEVEIRPIDKSGPFVLTKTYPTRDLATAQKIYRLAVEQPGEDPVLRMVGLRNRMVGLRNEAKGKTPSRRNIRKKGR